MHYAILCLTTSWQKSSVCPWRACALLPKLIGRAECRNQKSQGWPPGYFMLNEAGASWETSTSLLPYIPSGVLQAPHLWAKRPGYTLYSSVLTVSLLFTVQWKWVPEQECPNGIEISFYPSASRLLLPHFPPVMLLPQGKWPRQQWALSRPPQTSILPSSLHLGHLWPCNPEVCSKWKIISSQKKTQQV
jgi:hypothetical protein